MYANPTDIKKGKKYIILYVEILNLKILWTYSYCNINVTSYINKEKI